MSVLKIKDENGNWVGVPTIKGEKGEKGDKGDSGELNLHALRHASDGEDPITPADIGAAQTSHIHTANDVNSGTLSSDRLPTVPVAKGGTGGTTAAQAIQNLGAAPAGHAHTASEVGAATTALYTATIPTSGWSSSAPYTLDVTVNGILATDTPIVDITLPSDVDTAKQIIEDWAKVGRITTASNKITVYCYDEAPTVALPIQLKVVR